MKSDSQIKLDVLAELKWDPEIDESKIGVTASKGAVTLTGHVPTFRQKIAAKTAAKRVLGVMAIVDEIDVQLENEHRLSDEGLAERIASVLRWNVSNKLSNIKAEVKKGVVVITGDVEWQYQRANNLKNIEHVSGVLNVVDMMTLKPRATANDAQKRIMDALRRHADLEGSKISVTAVNGTVTLKGTVESLEEMDRIEAAAWLAPGVTKVVDNLRVA